MPLGNVLDTELKHKQNYFARRIKHNSQTDEKREMLTIYNVFEAENAVDATLPSFPRGIWTTDYLIPRVMLYQSPSKNLLAIF